ncbi:MAG TPA: hypothetical protein VH144_01810 [Candidatus Saccharimonadales bacterium]|nr:hypothetical protein [Candidatus Saccharimonadales bacterium]
MKSKNIAKITQKILVAVASFSLVLIALPVSALTSSSLSFSDPRAAQASVTYTTTASSVQSTNIKCIKQIYATTATGSTLPSGMVTTGATVSAASTLINASTSGWTLDATTNGTLTYTNATGITPSTTTGATFITSGITNATAAGTTYYQRFATYNDTGCTGAVDNVTIAYTYTTGQAVSISVDPSLAFTISSVASGGTVNGATTTATSTSSTIPLGTITSSANAIAAQDTVVTTNAGSGYTTYLRYLAAPTNGSHPFVDTAGSNASPATFTAAGTEAFGYTTSSTSLSGTAARFSGGKWAAFTTTATEVARNTAAASSDTTRIGFQAGVSGTTPAGAYTGTVIYSVTPLY